MKTVYEFLLEKKSKNEKMPENQDKLFEQIRDWEAKRKVNKEKKKQVVNQMRKQYKREMNQRKRTTGVTQQFRNKGQ